MELFILRHGKAEDAGLGGDAKRALTARGSEEIHRLAHWMNEQEYSFTKILASPLVRAQETAAIIAAETGCKKQVATWDALAPGGSPDDICYELGKYGDGDVILLVGHEPLLSTLVSRLVTGHDNAGIAMAKGGLARIRNLSPKRRPAGELQFLVTPKLVGKKE